VIFCACLGALFPFSPRWLPGKLDATIVDVGQGDAIFVVSPQGQTLLIDGGERLSRTSRGILEKKRSQRICGPGAFGKLTWSRSRTLIRIISEVSARSRRIFVSAICGSGEKPRRRRKPGWKNGREPGTFPSRTRGEGKHLAGAGRPRPSSGRRVPRTQ
jgi:hypothetical protein